MNKEDIDFLISIQNLEQPDFDNACLERENNRLNKEIDRLNNVISELEKWLIEYRTFIDIPDYYEEGIIDCIDDTLNKLKELKEINNEN